LCVDLIRDFAERGVGAAAAGTRQCGFDLREDVAGDRRRVGIVGLR
jgi:hypothetical protein